MAKRMKLQKASEECILIRSIEHVVAEASTSDEWKVKAIKGLLGQ